MFAPLEIPFLGHEACIFISRSLGHKVNFLLCLVSAKIFQKLHPHRHFVRSEGSFDTFHTKQVFLCLLNHGDDPPQNLRPRAPWSAPPTQLLVLESPVLGCASPERPQIFGKFKDTDSWCCWQNKRNEGRNLHQISDHVLTQFVDMDLAVLPHAMAWMSRDTVGEGIDEHFYGFLHSTKAWRAGVGAQVNRKAKKQKTQR